LEESIGTLASARAAYDKMIELKVATPETILNYAGVLEENRYFEESFKAFERGVALFDWPHVQDIWLNYLAKFIARYKGDKMFRTRELFEQALADVPKENCKALYLLLSDMEESYGDPRRALNALDRLCDAAPSEQKADLFLLYIGKAEDCFGISRARQVYESAIAKLEEPAQIYQLCLRYAEKERRLGEIDRARAILRFGSQHADPRVVIKYWRAWNDFEVAHGNEDTYREMLRVKRTVSVQYRQTNYALADPATSSAPSGVTAEESSDPAPEAHAQAQEEEAGHVAAQENEQQQQQQSNDEPLLVDLKRAAEDSPALAPPEKKKRHTNDGGVLDMAVQQQQVPASLFGDALERAKEERDAAAQAQH